MDRISDSGSEGCGSIPHGATRFLFTPGVEPAEVFTMPHQGILRLENPVIFLREDQKS